MLLDQQRKTLRIAASSGLPAEVHDEAEVRLGEGVAGKVAELGDAVKDMPQVAAARQLRPISSSRFTSSFVPWPAPRR